jgi:ligand-binding sensor domain-containing protein
MKKYLHLHFLFLMSVFCTSSKGQNKSDFPTDTSKSESKGAITSYGPNTSVRTITQDRKGNIWLASNEGIIRYDGKSFTNITGNLFPDRFFSVLEDRKGNFWFGNYGSGVYYYDGTTLKHFTTNEGLVNNRIACIYEDKKGNIWFGANGGISRYDGKSFRNYITERDTMIVDRTRKSFLDFTSGSNTVHRIIEDNTGKIWFGTDGNTFLYDGRRFTIFKDSEGNAFNSVWSIMEDKKRNIWLGGSYGLWLYDGNTFTQFANNFVGYIYEDKKGNIWTGGRNTNGIWSLSNYDKKLSSDKQPTVIEITQSRNLFGILEVHDGSIWLGSSDGVYRYDGNNLTRL